MDTTRPAATTRAVAGIQALPQLFSSLQQRGFEIIGPTVRDGAILYDTLHRPGDLPKTRRWNVHPGASSRSKFASCYGFQLSLLDAEDERIQQIRCQCRTLATLGVCVTPGGIQALRTWKDVNEFIRTVYAKPDFIATLKLLTPIAEHVLVDFELHSHLQRGHSGRSAASLHGAGYDCRLQRAVSDSGPERPGNRSRFSKYQRLGVAVPAGR